MRPFKFFFGLLFVAAAAFVLLKILFFAAFGALFLGALFFGARAYKRFGPGYHRHHWQQEYATPLNYGDYSARQTAEPLDPRQIRRPSESLAGGRVIEVL